jgi:aspartate aminotransferase
MKPWKSERLAGIELSATYAILDMVMEMRARGVSVLDMGGGEPDFDTPAHITAAATGALLRSDTHYTASRGRPQLLRAIAHKLEYENGVRADPASAIIATPSAKHALFATLMAILNPGDEIIIPSPSWVSYKSMVQLGGAVAVELPLGAASGFSITQPSLEARLTPRTRAILINTPNNPTGHVLTEAEAAMIVDFAQRNDLLIVADEIYEKIVYGAARHLSIASLPGAAARTLTINGFSKAYAMTGWRLGYVAGPPDIVAEILKVQQHTVGCAGSFVQQGGVAALTGDQRPVRAMLDSYTQRRRLIVDGLNAIPGISCHAPDGAFYVFPDIRGLGVGDSAAAASWFLRSAGVAVTPGTAFGAGGEGHVRLSFSMSPAIIGDALARIAMATAQECVAAA